MTAYSLHRTREFEKSFKRLVRGGMKDAVKTELETIINHLISGEHLPRQYQDHALNGEYEGFRECHIRGDLLLVYEIRRAELILVLSDIGSHSYLFG